MSTRRVRRISISIREALAPERNTEFLVECARRLPVLNFAEQATGRIYLRMVAGAPVWADAAALRAAMDDHGTRTGLLAVAPTLDARRFPRRISPCILTSHLGAERIHTLGRWGTRRLMQRPGAGRVSRLPLSRP